jgi:hypothetical protein
MHKNKPLAGFGLGKHLLKYPTTMSGKGRWFPGYGPICRLL